AAEGVNVRVVSFPSWELFAAQSKEYQDQVLPPAIKKRLSVEAGSTFGWKRWVGDGGHSIGIDRFGESAPGDLVMEKFGFTVENVIEQAMKLLKTNSGAPASNNGHK
ncbi:MAG: hypothetical protein H0S82_07095, partial [Anaerolineaceae bacterium]|nr:hypothetical protein [Anaerolineaceae bacterium]